jgi:hypothetical protein
VVLGNLLPVGGVPGETKEFSMRSRLVGGVLGALVLLLVPSTSYAKGPGHATISGPGLVTPIELGSASQFSPKSMELAIESGVWAFRSAPPNTRVSEARPTGDLGPRYDATFDMGTGSFRQQLYPFAVGGPATYSAPGQIVFEQRWKGGWYKADAKLRRFLAALGVPTPMPEPREPETVDTAATASPGDSGVPRSLIVGATAVALVAATAIVRAARARSERRRRSGLVNGAT